MSTIRLGQSRSSKIAIGSPRIVKASATQATKSDGATLTRACASVAVQRESGSAAALEAPGCVRATLVTATASIATFVDV